MEDNIKKLNIIRKFSYREYIEDFIKVEASKHLLQVTIEAMIDITNHIIARKRLGMPANSADAFNMLAKNDIISNENMRKYRLMTKFRNRIVHIYFEVDTKELYDIIQNNLGDFKAFISEIVKSI